MSKKDFGNTKRGGNQARKVDVLEDKRFIQVQTLSMRNNTLLLSGKIFHRVHDLDEKLCPNKHLDPPYTGEELGLQYTNLIPYGLGLVDILQ